MKIEPASPEPESATSGWSAESEDLEGAMGPAMEPQLSEEYPREFFWTENKGEEGNETQSTRGAVDTVTRRIRQIHTRCRVERVEGEGGRPPLAEELIQKIKEREIITCATCKEEEDTKNSNLETRPGWSMQDLDDFWERGMYTGPSASRADTRSLLRSPETYWPATGADRPEETPRQNRQIPAGPTGEQAGEILRRWGLIAIPPEPMVADALKRASKGEDLPDISKAAQRVLREYAREAGTRITDGYWATLALTSCVKYTEYINVYDQETHCEGCDGDVRSGVNCWRTSTHTIGVFGPEGRRAVCGRCKSIKEDQKAYNCTCLEKVLPLIENVRTGGLITLKGDF